MRMFTLLMLAAWLLLVPAAVLCVQVTASIDSTPMLEAPAAGKGLLVTGPDGTVIQLPQNMTNKEIKESMQSHFD